jgi:hypothetical protein
MKHLIIAILLVTLYTQRPSCVRVQCLCVDRNTAMVIRPNCPNPALNSCLQRVPCFYFKGKCQFLPSQYRRCVQNSRPPCVRAGCSSHLCVEGNWEGTSDVITTCEWRQEYACYRNATCARQWNGQCGWTQTPQVRSCLRNPPRLIDVEPNVCRKTGCGDMCASNDINTVWCTASYAYACYSNAECKIQAGGECGFTQTAALQACLADANAST